MQPSRFAALVCVPALAIATVVSSYPAHASNVDLADTARSEPMTLEFHPIRASANSKRSGESLKPSIDTAAPLVVNASLRMHVHADGAVSYDCSEDHAKASPAAASVPRQ
ncbi:MAG: hypothetical protein ACT4NL_12900 [Pseudomarimonas sp.]